MAGQEIEVRDDDELALSSRLLKGSGLDDPARDAAVARHDASEGVSRLYTDAGNAMRLADQYDGHILYSNALDWMVWDGRIWKRDETGRVTEMAKKTADAMREDAPASEDAAEAIVRSGWTGTDEDLPEAISVARARWREGVDKWAKSSESSAKLKAMCDLAKSDARLALPSVDDLDAIDNALNVRNGVLDLDTGELVPHHPRFLLTKLANAEYHEGAECPNWEATLELFLQDREVREWVQMAMGYSMLGRYSEWLFIPYGSGANGKSTILNAVRHTLGDYAGEAAPELLSEKREQTPGSDSARAGLRGMRFITTVETGKGKKLAEVLMKQLTGEARLTAKYMHKDYFEFQNQTAVWLATNHKPTVQGSDYGVWRRVRLIPFTTTLPEDLRRRPDEVNAELEAEADGILRWLVEGLRMYRERGSLDPAPDVVMEATREYQKEMNVMQAWLDDCCTLDADEWTTVHGLRQSYVQHCKETGTYELSPANFNSELRALGLEQGQKKILGTNTKVWKGIEVQVVTTATD